MSSIYFSKKGICRDVTPTEYLGTVPPQWDPLLKPHSSASAHPVWVPQWWPQNHSCPESTPRISGSVSLLLSLAPVLSVVPRGSSGLIATQTDTYSAGGAHGGAAPEAASRLLRAELIGGHSPWDWAAEGVVSWGEMCLVLVWEHRTNRVPYRADATTRGISGDTRCRPDACHQSPQSQPSVTSSFSPLLYFDGQTLVAHSWRTGPFWFLWTLWNDRLRLISTFVSSDACCFSMWGHLQSPSPTLE